MDLSPFKLDIDELIAEFTESELTTLDDMKRVWIARKFSYIYEAVPSHKVGFVMQSLYSHAIGHMISDGSLSRRLGGLYCLYCLYEIQPFKPPYRIYISLGELKKLKNLVVEAKEQCVYVVPAIVKRMIDKTVFLFGAVDKSEGSVCSTMNQFAGWQNAVVRVAYDKLFNDTRIEQFLHMDMGSEFDLNVLKKMSIEYAAAKKEAIKEAAEVVDAQNIQHIADDKEDIGDVIQKITDNWLAQRELFYQQTRVNKHPPGKGQQQQHQKDEVQDNYDAEVVADDFSRELELQLYQEEAQQGDSGDDFAKHQ